MKRFTSRQLAILTQLIDRDDFISSDQLSIIVGVVGKTIRTDIELMIETLFGKYAVTIEAKSGLGFRLNHDQKNYGRFLRDYHEAYQSIFPYTNNKSRLHYIIQRLVAAKAYIKISDLVDELYCSRTLISNTLKVVRKVLRDYNLSVIHTPNHGLKVEGRELHKRICLINEYSFYEMALGTIYEDKTFGDLFQLDEAQYQLINKTLMVFLKEEHNYIVSNSGIHKIKLAISLTINRNHQGLRVSFTEEEKFDTRYTYSYDAAHKILSELSQKSSIFFRQQDTVFMGIIMLGFRNILSFSEVHVKHNFNESLKLAEDAMADVVRFFNVEILEKDKLLRERLAMHVLCMRTRFRYNLIIDYIPGYLANGFSIAAIEMAVRFCRYLENETGHTINRNEVSYVAFLYISALARIEKPHKTDKHIAILSHISRDVSLSIVEQTLERFPKIARNLSAFELYQKDMLEKDRYDLIITDLSKEELEYLETPILEFDFMFSLHDHLAAKMYYNYGLEDFTRLMNLFNREYFFSISSTGGPTKTLQIIGKKLHSIYGKNDNFADALMQRNDSFPIEKGNNVAFMKSLENYEGPSFCSVFFLDKPVIWFKESVQCVFVFSTSADNNDDVFLFSGAFDRYIGSGLEMVNLLNDFSYDTFCKRLKAFYFSLRD